MKTNILVQYQGGGYDGCFWEWNFFYIDKQGGFHDIFSSGHAGIKDIAGLNILDMNDDNVYIYDMADEKAIEEFSRECNVVNVTGVLQWFQDNPDIGVEFFVLCSDCGCRIDDCTEASLEEWHGCGGIASTADKLLCSDCHSSGTCSCCDDYVGSDEITYLGGEYNFDDDYMNKAAREMLDDEYSNVCDNCLRYRAEQIKEQEHTDLLQQSLLTGTPDLFSDDMRWYWD